MSKPTLYLAEGTIRLILMYPGRDSGSTRPSIRSRMQHVFLRLNNSRLSHFNKQPLTPVLTRSPIYSCALPRLTTHPVVYVTTPYISHLLRFPRSYRCPPARKHCSRDERRMNEPRAGPTSRRLVPTYTSSSKRQDQRSTIAAYDASEREESS
jgi:hypothetical protein